MLLKWESIKQRRTVRGRALTNTLTVGVRQRSSLSVGVLGPSALWESVFLLAAARKRLRRPKKEN